MSTASQDEFNVRFLYCLVEKLGSVRKSRKWFSWEVHMADPQNKLFGPNKIGTFSFSNTARFSFVVQDIAYDPAENVYNVLISVSQNIRKRLKNFFELVDGGWRAWPEVSPSNPKDILWNWENIFPSQD